MCNTYLVHKLFHTYQQHLGNMHRALPQWPLNNRSSILSVTLSTYLATFHGPHEQILLSILTLLQVSTLVNRLNLCITLF